MASQARKICEYCGGETSIYTDKCPNCSSIEFDPVMTAGTPLPPQPQYAQPPPSQQFAQPLHKPHSYVYPQQYYTTQPEYPHPTKKSASFDPRKLKKRIKTIISLAAVLVVIGIFISILLPNVITTNHRAGNVIKTDWFKMTVHEGKIEQNVISTLNPVSPPLNHNRYFVKVTLQNHTYDMLDMDLVHDFYIEAKVSGLIGSISPINRGGNYSTYNEAALDSYGIFLNQFIISQKRVFEGYIVFDLPASASNVKFVYEEWEFDGDTPKNIKHYYKIPLHYTPIFE